MAALSDAVKTDLPPPKPNRRKRLALRFAAFVAAVSVLGAAYWFTRPPELVWWRSPTIGKTSYHAKVLIPSGWSLYGPPIREVEFDEFFLSPVDNRPWFLKQIMASPEKGATLGILVSRERPSDAAEMETGVETPRVPGRGCVATIWKRFTGTKEVAILIYSRSNRQPFNRTYRQICNSLTIE